jgi:hypothetical protein
MTNDVNEVFNVLFPSGLCQNHQIEDSFVAVIVTPSGGNKI